MGLGAGVYFDKLPAASPFICAGILRKEVRVSTGKAFSSWLHPLQFLRQWLYDPMQSSHACI